MKTFNDLKFHTHPLGVGVRAVIKFENGYCASVVLTPYTYGGKDGLYELAVLDSEGNLTYDTSVTSDVEGYLTESDVTRLMEQIQSL